MNAVDYCLSGDNLVQIMKEDLLQIRHMENARLAFTGVYVSLSTATGVLSHVGIGGVQESGGLPPVMVSLMLALASLLGGWVAVRTAYEVGPCMRCTKAIVDTLSTKQYFPVHSPSESCGVNATSGTDAALQTWLRRHRLSFSIVDVYILFYAIAFCV